MAVCSNRKRVIFLEAFTDGVPTGEDRDPPDEGSEHHEQEAQAIDPHVVVAERGNPRCGFYELTLFCRIEAQYQGQRDQEAKQAGGVGPQADGASVGGGMSNRTSMPARGVNRTIERIWSITLFRPMVTP
jgi:hypothetical protein